MYYLDLWIDTSSGHACVGVGGPGGPCANAVLHSAACTAQIVSHHCTVKQGSTTMDCAMLDFGVFKYIQLPFVLA